MLNLYVLLTTFVASRNERDERGATAVEYGLMVSLIAAVIVVAVMALGDNVKATFEGVVADLTK